MELLDWIFGEEREKLIFTSLQRNRTISWDWAKIASAISQLMKEGKNK